jgi:TonB family protein
MDTEVKSPVDQDLHLLTQWGAPGDRRRTGWAGLLSMLVHVAGIAVVVLFPETLVQPVREAMRQVTPLVEPLSELTQPTPNKGKIQKQFNEQSSIDRSRVQLPPSPPPSSRPAAPRFVPLPPVRAQASPAPGLPEPPRVESGVKLPPAPQLAQIQTPQIQPQENRPKSPFENPSAPAPAAGGPRIAAPNPSVAAAIRGAVRGGGSGGIVVGDGGSGSGGIGEAVNLPPSLGRQGSQLELLSDPLGVDFRPYLIKILAAVRRNWWAVMPEAARYGRRGRVGIQFSIARNGTVPKLVIVSASGTDALDRAAVAGISASNPFPPLPLEYKGDQVRLQFNFAYNTPNQ